MKTGRRRFLEAMAVAGAVAPAEGAAPPPRSTYNVTEFGATAGGDRLDTAAIQKAIDQCSQQGGGTVLFPPGRYLSGGFDLRSNVTLRFEKGATLLGSTNLADYPVRRPAFRSYADNYTERSLVYAEKAENIGICGEGRLDGQGAAFKGPYKIRPYMIRIIECRGVTVSGVTIANSPMWVQHYLACENVMIRGIRVHSRVNQNNDGIDIDCSERVTISDCEITSGDDAIVLKSTANRPTRNVVIANCVLSTACNALKLGTESNGGFSNIAISNCAIYDTRLAGIAIEMVDGGALERVSVSNIVMDGAGAPIFMRLGNRARPFREGGSKPAVGTFRDVTVRDVLATKCGITGCALAGIPGHFLENVTLSNIRLRFTGGGGENLAWREVPEEEAKYPEFKMFGNLPAFAFYCRHVRGLRMEGVELGFDKTEARPAIVFEDVERAQLEGSRALNAMTAFLRVRSGSRIRVTSNDFTGVAQPFDGPGIEAASNFY